MCRRSRKDTSALSGRSLAGRLESVLATVMEDVFPGLKRLQLRTGALELRRLWQLVSCELLGREQKPRAQLLFPVVPAVAEVLLRHAVAAIAVLLDFLLDDHLSSAAFLDSLRV